MDTYMHKTMASIASLEKIELIRSQELKFLKKKIVLGPKTAILGPQFCRILVLGPHLWWSGGPRPQGPPGSTPGGVQNRNHHSIAHYGISNHVHHFISTL